MGERRNHTVERMIGRRVKHYRELRGWSVRQLARAAGMAHTQVLKIERGEGTLPVGTLNKVARALGLVLSDLVREEDREARERAEHLVQMAAIMQRRKEWGAQEHALYIAQERWLEARARLYAEERQFGIAQPLHSHLEETETWRSPDVVPALVGAGGW